MERDGSKTLPECRISECPSIHTAEVSWSCSFVEKVILEKAMFLKALNDATTRECPDLRWKFSLLKCVAYSVGCHNEKLLSERTWLFYSVVFAILGKEVSAT